MSATAQMFPLGPVEEATDAVQAVCSKDEIKTAAIHKLHQLHRESVTHHFEEAEKDQHIAAWTVVKVSFSRARAPDVQSGRPCSGPRTWFPPRIDLVHSKSVYCFTRRGRKSRPAPPNPARNCVFEKQWAVRPHA